MQCRQVGGRELLGMHDADEQLGEVEPHGEGHWNAASIVTRVSGSVAATSRFCGLASPCGNACGS